MIFGGDIFAIDFDNILITLDNFLLFIFFFDCLGYKRPDQKK